MACANMDLDIDTMEELPLQGVRKREAGVTKQYQALEIVPQRKALLHDLLQKQPAVLGSLQVMSGLLCVGVGIIFAVTEDIGCSLFSLFRVSQMTGALFIISGLVTNMLFKYPEFLQISLIVNCGCVCATIVAAPLIIVDLAQWDQGNYEYLKVEAFVLCLMGLEFCLSIILCVWFTKEKQKFTP